MGRNILRRIWLILLSVGPGIFCIGYTIGTGSVTSMSKAGSAYGMQLLWVLFLSVVFAWVMMEAYGRFGVVTGSTAMHSFRKYIPAGKFIAILAIVGVTFGQWNALAGILGLSANAFYEILHIYYPGVENAEYILTLIIGIVLMLIMYLLLLRGNYAFFEKVLVVFVTVMGLAFIVSVLIVPPPVADFAKGMIPSIPERPDGSPDLILVAAFVGTTMAAPTFVVRPLLMKGKGWTAMNRREQSKDALTSAILMFVISGAVMAAAAGAIFLTGGKPVTFVLDMVQSLEPVAGRLAMLIFIFGAVSAGLSSIFPILMVLPLLIADYRSGELDTNSRQFRILTLVAAILGLTVLVIGANPVEAQILTQIFSVFILPVVIGGMIYLINRKDLVGEHRPGLLLNAGMWLALAFSITISYAGVLGIIDKIGAL